MPAFIFGYPINSMPIYSLMVNVLLVVIIFVIIFIVGKPLMVMLMAKLTGKGLALVFRKDRRLDFSAVKYMSGTLRSRQYGDYGVTPQSSYSLPNGLLASVIYEPYGVTLNDEVIKSAQELRELDVQSYEKIEKHLLAYAEKYAIKGKDDKGKEITRYLIPDVAIAEGVLDEKKWKDISKLIPEEQAEIKNKLVDWLVEIKFHETIANDELEKLRETDPDAYANELKRKGRFTTAVHSIVNFFRYNVNPQAQRMVVNTIVAKVKEEYKQTNWPMYVFLFTMVIIGAALAYVIIQSAGNDGGGAVQSGGSWIADAGSRVVAPAAPAAGANIG